MGEIIYSLCIGGFLVATGIAMNICLSREEKRECGKKQDDSPEKEPEAQKDRKCDI